MASGKQLPGYETYLLVPAVEIDGVVNLIGDTLLEMSEAAFTANPDAAQGDPQQVARRRHPRPGRRQHLARAARRREPQPSDSDTDDERDVTQKGQAANLTTENFDFSANIFVDADQSAAGKFNAARLLLAAPDLPYAAIKRTGPNWDVAFATGDQFERLLRLDGQLDLRVPGQRQHDHRPDVRAEEPPGSRAHHRRVRES